MKKLIAGAVAALTLVGSVFAAHPMTYVFDMAEMENGATHQVVKNPYADNYQSNGNPEFTTQVKGDLPKAGDKIEMHYKFTCDKDLNGVSMTPVDTSAKANYWTTLTTENAEDLIVFESIKAGEVYEGTFTYTLAKDAVGKITFPIMYDDPKITKKGYKTNGTNSTFTFQPTGVATTKVTPVVKRKAKTWKIDMSKYAAFWKIEADHPWVNGVCDTKTISGWQATLDLTTAMGGDLPIEGDTIVLTFKGTSDTDITLLKSLLVDNSQDAGWWTVLCEKDDDSAYPLVKDVVAGKPFTLKATYKVVKDSKGGCIVAVRASVDAMEHPAIVKATK